MSKKNLEEIWSNIYFSEGNETSGLIVTYSNLEPIAEYEIKENVLYVYIYKDYQFDDDVYIEDSIMGILEEINLEEETKIKISMLN